MMMEVLTQNFRIVIMFRWSQSRFLFHNMFQPKKRLGQDCGPRNSRFTWRAEVGSQAIQALAAHQGDFGRYLWPSRGGVDDCGCFWPQTWRVFISCLVMFAVMFCFRI